MTSNQRVDLGGGQWRYTGDIWIGDYLQLKGVTDSVVDTGSTIQVNGTLAYRTRSQRVLTQGNAEREPEQRPRDTWERPGMQIDAGSAPLPLARPPLQTSPWSQASCRGPLSYASRRLSRRPTLSIQVSPSAADSGTVSSLHFGAPQRERHR